MDMIAKISSSGLLTMILIAFHFPFRCGEGLEVSLSS